LCLPKYLSSCVRTYSHLYPALGLRLRPGLNSDLGLDRNLKPYAALNRASLRKSFEKPYPATLRSLHRFKYRSLCDLVNLAPYRAT